VEGDRAAQQNHRRDHGQATRKRQNLSFRESPADWIDTLLFKQDP
jgi:hypothetical protein